MTTIGPYPSLDKYRKDVIIRDRFNMEWKNALGDIVHVNPLMQKREGDELLVAYINTSQGRRAIELAEMYLKTLPLVPEEERGGMEELIDSLYDDAYTIKWMYQCKLPSKDNTQYVEISGILVEI